MLSPNQLRAVRLLAAGFNRKDVADRVGVSVSTIKNWVKDEEFAEATMAALDQHLEMMEDALLEGERAALQVLLEAMKATKFVMVGSGDSAELVETPDWTVRLKASLRFLDAAGRRGKPIDRQEFEVFKFDGQAEDAIRDALQDPTVRRYFGKRLELPPAVEGEDFEVIEEDGDTEGTDELSNA